ncbi:MAG: hypothetical protein ACYDEO_12370 [Aggregatilineales bacterium]
MVAGCESPLFIKASGFQKCGLSTLGPPRRRHREGAELSRPHGRKTPSGAYKTQRRARQAIAVLSWPAVGAMVTSGEWYNFEHEWFGESTMLDMQRLYELVDTLPYQELEQLNRYIQRRRQTTVWAVPPEALQAVERLMRPTHGLTASMAEDEINTVLDEALAEVRRERKAQDSD